MSDNETTVLNREYKDSVFRIVFNNKQELLSLYNALTDRNYTNPEDLTVNTLQDAVFIGIKNDLSFIIGDTLSVYEHQSSFSYNFPLKGFFYIADLYKQMYYSEKIHAYTMIKLLTPQLVFFYNGPDRDEDIEIRKLSDSFINPDTCSDLEVTAHIYNINYGHNRDLALKCKKLNEYSVFVRRIKEALQSVSEPKDNYATKQVILVTIDKCIEDDILADILRKERLRIMDTILGQFDTEKYIQYEKEESYTNGYDAGHASGFDEGHASGALDATISFYLQNLLTKENALKGSLLSETEFDRAVEEYKTRH